MLDQVRQVLPGLNLQPDQDAQPLLDEIVERSGLLLSIDGGESYQFAHLTLQEFFAAAELIDEADGLIDRFRADPDVWRETVKLWCGLARDSTALIREVYATDPITAFECLADAQKADQALVDEIVAAFKTRLGEAREEEAIARAFGAVASDLRPRGAAVFKFLEETLVTAEKPARRALAANALSFTNLPQAAKVLADQYADLTEVRAPLVRMGDLVVPVLASLAEAGFVEAMDDLHAIGTSQAAEALVPLLWHADQSLAHRAAWRLVALLPQPNVENVLRDYKLTEEQRKADWLDWVWGPFDEPSNSALPIIAGRIAYLMDQAPLETAPTTPPVLDPRVIIPLCSIKAEGEIKYLSGADARWIEGGIADEIAGMASLSAERRVQMIEETLGAINASLRWRFLLATLLPSLQFDLLHRLIEGPRLPTRDDWRNIFRPAKYEFKTGWHYRGILAIAAIVSIIALVQMTATILRSPKLLSWGNGAVLVAAIVMLWTWGVFLALGPRPFVFTKVLLVHDGVNPSVVSRHQMRACDTASKVV